MLLIIYKYKINFISHRVGQQSITKVMHTIHIYIQTVFSCVYYVQANSGDLQIKMPLSRIQEGYNVSYKILQQNIFNSEQLTYL